MPLTSRRDCFLRSLQLGRRAPGHCWGRPSNHHDDTIRTG